MEFKGMFNKLIIGILIIVILFAAYNVLSSFNFTGGQKPAPSPTVQIATVTSTPSPTPAKLGVTVLTVPECRDCFDVDAFVFALQEIGAQLTIEKFSYNSTEGNALVGKYSIKKLPTVILSGEISKVPQLEALLQKAADEKDGKFVIRDIAPPYLDLEKKEIVGRVSFRMVYDQNCFPCRRATVPISSTAVNASLLAETLKDIGVGVGQDLEFEQNTTEAQQLIKQYNITRLPAIIVSKDIEEYKDFAEAFKKIGTVEKDGSIVLRQLNPPYLNLANNGIEGELTVVYIKAGGSCDPECYDYTLHRQALERLGAIASTSLYYEYDSLLGKNYTKTYNLTKVPTIIVSPEVKLYPAFMSVYEQIGAFEKDGWFVFRNFEVLEGATYFDLEQNKTITRQGG